jgi:hypothetical protein
VIVGGRSRYQTTTPVFSVRCILIVFGHKRMFPAICILNFPLEGVISIARLNSYFLGKTINLQLAALGTTHRIARYLMYNSNIENLSRFELRTMLGHCPKREVKLPDGHPKRRPASCRGFTEFWYLDGCFFVAQLCAIKVHDVGSPSRVRHGVLILPSMRTSRYVLSSINDYLLFVALVTEGYVMRVPLFIFIHMDRDREYCAILLNIHLFIV